MESNEDKSIQTQAVEALLYAPVGIALELLDHLPTWVARGKSQVTIGRFVGKMAAQKGQHELDSVLGDIFGVDRQHPTDGAEEASADDSSGPASNGSGKASGDSKANGGPKKSSNAKGKTTAKASTAKSTTKPKKARLANKTKAATKPVAGASLALESYDTLTASQIVKRLNALSKAQLEAIAAYEAQNRHRVTILNRVRQIQTG
ncbi:MAG: hypothetical protein V3V01_12340 [Acidimicrobiales bacterium]